MLNDSLEPYRVRITPPKGVDLKLIAIVIDERLARLPIIGEHAEIGGSSLESEFCLFGIQRRVMAKSPIRDPLVARLLSNVAFAMATTAHIPITIVPSRAADELL
jgi:hypothetical protein